MELPRPTFDTLRSLIYRLCGLVIPEDKAYLIRYRLEPLVRQTGCSGFDEFAKKLSGPGGVSLHDAIVDAITTGETSFFRDRHPFEAFRQHIFPRLAETARSKSSHAREVKVRIWCAGCSTGQEPYSLAMLIHDYLAANRAAGLWDCEVRILATDVSAKVQAGAAGEYTERDVARGLTPDQLTRYFQKRGQQWVIRDSIRRLVEFRRLNLLHPLTGLGTFDAILCRNVLIYFDEASRRRICEQFYSMLNPQGFLMLGTAENLYGINDRFVSIRYGNTLVFRKPANA
jgi:chemotaxis protein methyltransferase CheR